MHVIPEQAYHGRLYGIRVAAIGHGSGNTQKLFGGVGIRTERILNERYVHTLPVVDNLVGNGDRGTRQHIGEEVVEHNTKIAEVVDLLAEVANGSAGSQSTVEHIRVSLDPECRNQAPSDAPTR